MKWLGWAILAFMCILGTLTRPANAAIDTVPSSELPIKVNGPLLITGYSFSGHTVNYVQVYNSSSAVVDLDGWKAGYEYSGAKYNLAELHGKLAPRQYVVVARDVVLPGAVFVFGSLSSPSDPVLTSVILTV